MPPFGKIHNYTKISFGYAFGYLSALKNTCPYPACSCFFLLDIKKPDRFVLHRSRFYLNCISLSVFGDKLHNKCQLIFAKVLLFKHIHLKDPSTW